MKRVLALLLTTLLMTGASSADEQERKLDPKAMAELKRMSDFLAKLKSFNVDAEIHQDEVLDNGLKAQSSELTRLRVQRPNKLWSRTVGDDKDRQWTFDGKKLTLHDQDKQVFGHIEMPGTLDHLFQQLGKKWGASVPLADLLFSNVKTALMTDAVLGGSYLGVKHVGARRCHHLAFAQERINWQLWIDVGDKPLPRKIVITYKEEEAQPQWITLLRNWELSPKHDAKTFVAQIPAGTEQIEFVEPKADDKKPSEPKKNEEGDK